MINKRIILAFLLTLTGCFGKSTPSNFYRMVPMESDGKTIAARRKITVYVDTVSVPDYLRRPQIVTLKENQVELNISDNNRWVGIFSSLVNSVVTANLSLYVKNIQVRQVPDFNSQDSNYIVSIALDRFEGQFGGDATLEASWLIKSANSGVVVAQGKSKFTEPAGDDYPSLVRSMSVLLGKMSMDIGNRLATLN